MQDAVWELDALPALCALYANRSEDADTRLKALGGAAALVQGNATRELAFLHGGGLAALRADAQLGEPRLRARALFALAQLLRSNAALRAAALRVEEDAEGRGKGIIPELAACLALPDPRAVEYAISALLAALQDA